jgi:hypothetical protein
MEMEKKATRWLVLLLRVDGVFMASALIAALMPFAWMGVGHEWLGMGELERSPVVEYLARSASLLYCLVGLMQIYMTVDIRRYYPIVRFMMIARIGVGAVMLWIDLVSSMPTMWTAGEGPMWIVLSVVALWLGKKARLGGPGA